MVKFVWTIGVLLVTLVLFEWMGQSFFLKNKLYLVNNVDHRIPPHRSPDINSDGIRSPVEANEINDEDLNIVFLGDSFVYGYRLDFEDTMGQQLERKARIEHPERGVQVINFGWTSSSPLLSYRLLKDIGGKYKPDVVILGLDMSDFHDDIKYLKLLEGEGIYRVKNIAPITFLAVNWVIGRIGWLEEFHEWLYGFPGARFYATDRTFTENLTRFAYLRANIEAIARFSRTKLDARFILMIFPRNYQHSDREAPNNWEKHKYETLGPYALEPFKYFDSIRSELDFPVFSLLPDFLSTEVFPTVFDDDPHWNKDGAGVAAKAVYAYCLEAGCFNH